MPLSLEIDLEILFKIAEDWNRGESPFIILVEPDIETFIDHDFPGFKNPIAC